MSSTFSATKFTTRVNYLCLYENQPQKITWKILDESLSPVDLSAANLFLRVNEMDSENTIFEHAPNDFTIGGLGNNEVDLDLISSDMKTPGNFQYYLYELSTDKLYATGLIRIIPTDDSFATDIMTINGYILLINGEMLILN